MGKKRKSLGTVRWIILIVCAIVFCGCASYLGLYYKDIHEAQNGFEEVAEAVSDNGLEEAYEKNSDTIGWIKISGTKIDYPVMQTPDDPEYYLHRDFDKEKSDSGTPFMDAASIVGAGDFGTENGGTWNWMIYGHHMKAGTMFGQLEKYQDKEFWQEHPEFEFDVILKSNMVIVENCRYEIFAAARSEIRSKDSSAFKYYQYAGYTDKETFDEFVAGVKAESLYNTGITPEYGDQLVTLSTCAYHTDNGRFYVVGVAK